MSTIEKLATQITSTTQRSASTRQILQLHIADTVAAWVAGAQTHEGRDLLAAARQGDAGPFGGGVMGRVMQNCAVTRLSEIDDIHLAAGTTPGSLIVPAALTLAGALNSTTDLEQAMLAGYDALVRLGEEIGGASALYRGIWPTYFNAPYGVAAVASKLLGLDATQTAHALSLALVTASPNVGQQSGKMARWLLLGAAAKNGAMAALAAKQGFTGDLTLLDKPFHAVYGLKIDAERLLASMQKPPAILEVGFKPWCAARQTMAAAQGFKEILSSGVNVKNIESIKVQVPPAYLGMVNHGVVPGDRSSHMTSLPYQLVLAALAPEKMALLDYAPSPTPAEHLALLARIHVEADESLMAHFPRSWPARIEVNTKSGAEKRLITDIPGDPGRPFDENQLGEKFKAVLAANVGGSDIESLLRLALDVLDQPENTTKLLNQIEKCCAH
ncbi:MAG: MmgE/PrpD family protein [Burkholderiales bacterium]